MAKITYNHIERAGVDKETILKRARKLRVDMKRHCGYEMPLQDAVDASIDAAIEYAQG